MITFAPAAPFWGVRFNSGKMETRDKIVIDPLYAPCISFWAVLAQAGSVLVDGKSFYRKGSYRNRCHIYGANGLLRLSVPLEHGKHQRRTMDAVTISYDHPWQRLHWESLSIAYRSTPYFEYYESGLEPFYSGRYETLMAFNLALSEHLAGLLGLPWDVEFAEEYLESYDGRVDLRDCFHPRRPPVTASMEPYRQVFSPKLGFLPDLSILDLLFHKGPAAGQYLGEGVRWAESP